MGLSFFNYYCYVRTHIYIHTCMYNLLSPCNVYMFSGVITWYKITGQGFILGKTKSPSLNSLYLPVALPLRAGSHEVSPHPCWHVNLCHCSDLVKQPCCWDFLGVASLSRLGDTISQQTPILWLWQPNPLFYAVPWALGRGVVLWVHAVGQHTPQSVNVCILTSCRFL